MELIKMKFSKVEEEKIITIIFMGKPFMELEFKDDYFDENKEVSYEQELNPMLVNMLGKMGGL